MATDAPAVMLALGVSYVASRPAGARSTFGYHRTELLAALLNAAVLLGVCGYLVWAGVSRLGDPVEVDAGPMVGFAVVGLAANGSLAILTRSDTGGLLCELSGCVAEHFGVQHATFQVEPGSHREQDRQRSVVVDGGGRRA